MNSICCGTRGVAFVSPFLPLKALSLSYSSIHCQDKEPILSALISSICNLLKNGGKWDDLTSAFKFADLNSITVEKIIQNLVTQADAKNSLLFFHWSSQCKQHRHSIKSYCLVVHILVRANLLVDAKALLESAITKTLDFRSIKNMISETLLSTSEDSIPDPRVFNLLVQTFLKMKLLDQAYDACCFLGENGINLSLQSFNRMLHLAQRSNDFDLAWQVYEKMLERRIYPNQSSVETMVSLMSKEGSLQRMINILDRIRGKRCAPGVLVNMALVLWMFEQERIEQGFVLLRRMLLKNLILDDVVSSLIIFGYCKIEKIDEAVSAYVEMKNRGCPSNAFLYTCFISVRCNNGQIEEALRLLQEMHSIGLKPYDETYNHLIKGCVEAEKWEECLSFYDDMKKEGLMLSFSTFSNIVGKLCDVGRVEKADEMLTALSSKGFVPNEDNYCHLIHGYGRIGKAQKSISLYHEMKYRALEIGPQVYAALVASLSLCGKLKEVEKFIKMMEDDCLVPTRPMYEALINGYIMKGDANRALHFSNVMKSKQFL